MEAEARYTYVGAAVLALVAALVAAVVWMKRIGSEEDFRRYTIYFEQQRLEGLQSGGDVDLRGITVGRVERFRLADYAVGGGEVNRVRVTIRLDRHAPVRTNTVAVVTRNFVTGIAQISLVTPEPAGPPLDKVPDGEPHPLIAEGRSDLDEITGKVGRLGDMAADVMGNVNRLLTTENRETMMQAIRNLRDVTDGLNRRLVRLDRTLDSLAQAASGVGRTGDRLAATAEQAGERFDDLVGDAQRTLSHAERSMSEVTRVVAGLQQEARSVAQRLDRSATALDDQLVAAVSELRLSVDAAARALDRLQDPRAALFGPAKAQLGPGEALP